MIFGPSVPLLHSRLLQLTDSLTPAIVLTNRSAKSKGMQLVHLKLLQESEFIRLATVTDVAHVFWPVMQLAAVTLAPSRNSVKRPISGWSCPRRWSRSSTSFEHSRASWSVTPIGSLLGRCQRKSSFALALREKPTRARMVQLPPISFSFLALSRLARSA